METEDAGLGGGEMKLVLLGPPAAGKGTQAGFLSRELQVPHVSTGEIIREEIRRETALGKSAKEGIGRGQLLSDGIVCEMVGSWLEGRPTESGFIFDGFPRSVPQAETLEQMLADLGEALDAVLFINARRDVIESRVLGRLWCQSCRMIFNTSRDSLELSDPCPVDGGPLSRRDDDTLEILAERLREYEKVTAPLVSYYKKSDLLREIDGNRPPEAVFAEITSKLATVAS